MKGLSRLSLAFAALLTLAAAPPSTPQSVVERFYAITLAHVNTGGVPDAAERAKLAPLVTPALAQMLADADAAEARYAKKTKNEVPPLVEGDLFSSLFEGPTAAKVGACTAAAPESVRCKVSLTYVDTRDASTTKWTDDVALTKTGAEWRIADLVYGGTWDFGKKGRLTELLRDVVKSADSE